MILVTGAAGKTGLSLIRSLSEKGIESRALIHREAHEEKVRQAGASEIVLGNLENGEALETAIAGANSLYLIVPNVHPKEIEIGRSVIEIAQNKGIRHIVYHSVLFPQVEAMPHHWRKLRVEEALIQSGLNFTILQPANYMQNILAYWDGIVKHGEFKLPYRAEAHSTPVDLMDVAEAAGKVLGDPEQHYGASYALAGPERLSSIDIAQKLSTHLGGRITAKMEPVSDWQTRVEIGGMEAERMNTLLQMFYYYDEHDFEGNSTILEHLLGRPPTLFMDFLARETK